MKNKPKELLFTCKGDHTGMVINGEVEIECVCGRMGFILSMLSYFAAPRAGSEPQSHNQPGRPHPAQSPVVLIKRKEFLPFPF